LMQGLLIASGAGWVIWCAGLVLVEQLFFADPPSTWVAPGSMAQFFAPVVCPSY
jgi:hypothetical protein